MPVLPAPLLHYDPDADARAILHLLQKQAHGGGDWLRLSTFTPLDTLRQLTSLSGKRIRRAYQRLCAQGQILFCNSHGDMHMHVRNA